MKNPSRQEGGVGDGGRALGGRNEEELIGLRFGIVLEALRHAGIEFVDPHRDLGPVYGEADPVLVEHHQSGVPEELVHAGRIEEPQVVLSSNPVGVYEK